MMMELCNTPINFEDVQSYSRSDPVISRDIDCVVNSERSDKHETDDPEMNRYMRRCYELSVEDNTLLRGNRVVVPPSL